MIDQIISYSVKYVITSFSLIHWTNKKEIDKPRYLSLLISLVLLVLIIPLYLIFDIGVAFFIAYFTDSFLGAFLISKLYKTDFVNALKFFSWLIFGLLFLLFFVLIVMISWILLFFI